MRKRRSERKTKCNLMRRINPVRKHSFREKLQCVSGKKNQEDQISQIKNEGAFFFCLL